jgi:hypothetical protein
MGLLQYLQLRTHPISNHSHVKYVSAIHIHTRFAKISVAAIWFDELCDVAALLCLKPHSVALPALLICCLRFSSLASVLPWHGSRSIHNALAVSTAVFDPPTLYILA